MQKPIDYWLTGLVVPIIFTELESRGIIFISYFLVSILII